MHHAVTVGCDQLAGVAASSADDDDGERRHTTMRLALLFPWFGPYSGVPALAVKSVRMAIGFEASLSHPTETTTYELRATALGQPLNVTAVLLRLRTR